MLIVGVWQGIWQSLTACRVLFVACWVILDPPSTRFSFELPITQKQSYASCVPQIRTLILLLLWKYLLHLCWWFVLLENPTFVGLNKMQNKTLSREHVLFCPPRCAAWSTEILRCCFPVIYRHILRNVPGIVFFERPRGGTSGPTTWTMGEAKPWESKYFVNLKCLKSCSCNISRMNQPQNPWFRRKKWMFSKWPSLPFRSTVFSHVEVKRTIKSPRCSGSCPVAHILFWSIQKLSIVSSFR